MESKLEFVLQNFHKKDMIAYLNAYSFEFDNALQLAISNQQPLARRAAWLLWSCIQINDPRVAGFVPAIVQALPGKNVDHQRELIKILLLMNYDSESEGRLFSLCSDLWLDVGNDPSVRFNAMKMLVKICQNHPDLVTELKLMTESQYLETLSNTAQKSICKMLNF